MTSLARQAAAPLLSYFSPRFEALAELVRQRSDRLQGRLDELARRADDHTAQLQALLRAAGVEAVPIAADPAQPDPGDDPADPELLQQARQLARIDVTRHNATGARPSFDRLVSQAPASRDFEHPLFVDWVGGVHPHERGQVPALRHRKMWEYVYIAEAARQAGVLRPGARALGFGVGREPLPAMLAAHGVQVLATDQAAENSGDWATTGQHLQGLSALRKPEVVSDEELARLVEVRAVDMNDPLDDLGSFDLVWSSCALEHLGSPELGLDFLVRAARLLAPGGVSVHTTELELTRRTSSPDYGHCAVYVLEDLLAAADRLRAEGFAIELEPYVAMDAPEDRWVSREGVVTEEVDLAHLKLQIQGSISTSFGMLVRRLPTPAAG